MSNIVLVADTGSDISLDLAKQKDIYLVPMHVSMDNEFRDDGTFPPEEICTYFDRTGKLPTTSGSAPGDFTKIFDEIHARWPEKLILYLGYSAVTTCSYQSALLAAEGRDYITCIDTKHVSAGQGAIVLQIADLLADNPSMSIDEVVYEANILCTRAKMVFIPDDLKYLKAGGRVCNATCLVGRILNIHPCIEILNGSLVGTKKYRGAMEALVPKLMKSYTNEHNLNRDRLWLIGTVGLSQSIMRIAERVAAELKFKSISWVKPGSVITTHGGPRAFGMVGFCV